MNARRNPVPPESIRDAAALMLAIVTSDHNGVDAILDHCDTDSGVRRLIARAKSGPTEADGATA